MRIICAVLLLSLLLVPCASAEWGEWDDADFDIISDVTYYNGTLEEDSTQMYSLIDVVGVDPDETTNVVIDSSFWTANVTISQSYDYVTIDGFDVHVNYENKITGNTSQYDGTWLRLIKTDNMFFSMDTGDTENMRYTFSGPDGKMYGGLTRARVLIDDVPIPPTKDFTVTADHPVDLQITIVPVKQSERMDYAVDEGGNFLESIPYVGPYLSGIFLIIITMVKGLFIFAEVFFTNWTFFLVVFETFVFMHAISIMQKKSRHPASDKITKSLQAIIGDNRVIVMFLIDVFTKLVDMFTSAARMIRG